MHVSRSDYDVDAVEKNIERLTKLGLQVHITELDVSLPVDSQGRAGEDDIRKQADMYGHIVRACLQNPNCTANQTGGFTDKYSWIGSHSRGTRGAALPFDRLYKPRLAYNAILQELNSGRKVAH